MSFRTAEPALKELLDGIHKGSIQLPEFQRGWVWDDAHIRSLIASLSLSYPIGAVMLLQAGGVPFKPRLFEGVDLKPEPTPQALVLDGQQRLTSMYLSLRSGKPVKTRTEKREDIHRYYFLNMADCLDSKADREDAVVSVPDTFKVTSDFGRKIELDLSTPELQYAKRMFPVSVMFDAEQCMAWESGFSAYYQFSAEAMQFMQRFRNAIWLSFQQFKVPAIELSADTPREAVCQVFEKVNTGGVTLTVFELVTATFAAENVNLRQRWEESRKRLREREVLKAVDGTAFLTAVTLLASYERMLRAQGAVGCKRADVLRLPLTDYERLRSVVEDGFRRAAELLAEDKIFDDRGLPYVTQLIPLAAICARLANRLDQHGVKQKVRQWYWSGVFGELYGSANETRFALDLPEVVAWIDGGPLPRTVKDASFAPGRLLSLQTRQSAAYKGMAALLMKRGGNDFISGTPIDLNIYFNNKIDIHHVFPKAWCQKQSNVPREKWNSIINKTPLSAGTNRYIGGDAPSNYLAKIEKQKQVSQGDLDEFLASHLIPVGELRTDNFDAFLRRRATALLDTIEAATGKAVVGRDSEETVSAFGGVLL
jgi:hypothetical protein